MESGYVGGDLCGKSKKILGFFSEMHDILRYSSQNFKYLSNFFESARNLWNFQKKSIVYNHF